MANGATEERIDIEMGNIVENIINPNTESKKKRQLKITIDFVPDETRESVAVQAHVESKLQPYAPIQTLLYVGANNDGELQAVEAVRQVPGQLNMNGSEQASEKVINIGNVKQA